MGLHIKYRLENLLGGVELKKDSKFLAAVKALVIEYQPTANELFDVASRLKQQAKDKRQPSVNKRGFVCVDAQSSRRPFTGQEKCAKLTRRYKNLAGMPYKQYLQTEYWRAVRELKLRNSTGRCEFCGSTERIHVHHETYIHRGREYDHLEELTLACENCHNAIHGKQVA